MMFPARRSIRLPNYDYSQPGAYFITLVAHQRESIFGRFTRDRQIVLNPVGRIILCEWQNLARRFPVELDEFVVMPNHFHGILMIVESQHPLGVIVNQFKARVTRNIRAWVGNSDYPVWQRNYYEHIIRNESDLVSIRCYIQENSLNWNNDQLHIP